MRVEIHITYLLNIGMAPTGGRANFYFLIRVLTEDPTVPFSPPSSVGSLGTAGDDAGFISLVCSCFYTEEPGRQGKPQCRENVSASRLELHVPLFRSFLL